MRSASVGPSTSSITSAWRPIGAFEAVDHRDVGMAERGEGPGFALEARQTIGVLRDRLGQYLDCDLPPEVRIGGPIHFAHPTRADLGDDFIRADARAWLQRHMGRVGLYETHSAGGIHPLSTPVSHSTPYHQPSADLAVCAATALTAAAPSSPPHAVTVCAG